MSRFESVRTVADLTQAEKQQLATRLWLRGFRCFASAPPNLPELDPALPDVQLRPALELRLAQVPNPELAYAVLEFQIHTRYSPFLAVKDGVGLNQSSANIREKLGQKLEGAPLPDGTWSDGWSDCLDLWDGLDEPEETRVAYQCPVLIERLTDTVPGVSEDTNLDNHAVDKSHVWEVSKAESGKQFTARDYSGMFAIAPDDPAHGDPPPAAKLAPAWLFSRRILAARTTEKFDEFGLTVKPWLACELRPTILPAPERELVRTEDAWASAFRIVRAVSEEECLGYLDVIQSYDDAYLSLTPFHFAIPGVKDKMPRSPLGGVVSWLTHSLPRSAEDDPFLAKVGLRLAFGTDWRDDEGAGADYETGSGEADCTPSGVERVLANPALGIDLDASLDILRRPQMAYRIAMLLRTSQKARHALWRYALHRLRQLAWLRMPDDAAYPKDWRGQPLGAIVTSEAALAMILRLAVYRPGLVLSGADAPDRMRRDIRVANYVGSDSTKVSLARWMLAAHESAGGNAETFESHLIGLMTGARVYGGGAKKLPELHGYEAAQLRDIAAWPKWHGDPKSAFRMTSAEIKGGLERKMSSAPHSSPFGEPHQGQWRFRDPFPAFLEGENGRPAPANAPTYYAWDNKGNGAVALRETARKAGIAPTLPGKRWPADASIAALDERVTRELQAATACGRVRLPNGSVVQVDAGHTKRTHDQFNQRWARLQADAFFRRQARTALLCGTDADTPPAPNDECWSFQPDQVGKTIHAHDARGTAVLKVPIGICTSHDGNDFVVTSAAGTVAATDRNAFGIANNALAQSTHDLFARACQSVDAAQVDTFAITSDAKAVRARFAWADLKIDWSASAAAPASDFGFLLAVLGWKSADQEGSAEQHYLKALGLLPQHLPGDALFKNGWAIPDGWHPQAAVELWRPRPGKPSTKPTTSADLALGLLTWPALHRFGDMLRTSAGARRALYDAWRIRLRDVLNERVVHWGMGKPRVFELFPSAQSLRALAVWQALDAQGLRKTLGRKNGAPEVLEWLAANPAKKDVSNWDAPDEFDVLWNRIIPNLPAGHTKTILEGLRPVPPLQRPAHPPQLDQLIDLSSLDRSARPDALGGTSAKHVAITPRGVPLRFGVIAEPAPVPAPQNVAPSNAALANATAQHTITGLVFMAESGGITRGAQLPLPAPVSVSFDSTGAQTTRVKMFAAAGSGEEVDVVDADFDEGFGLETDIGAWFGGFGHGVQVLVSLSGRKDENGHVAFKLGGRIAAPFLRGGVPLQEVEIGTLQVVVDPMQQELIWTLPPDYLEAINKALPFSAKLEGTLTLTVGLHPDLSPKIILRAELKSLAIPLGSPIATLALKPAPETDKFTLEADLGAGRASITPPARTRVSLDLQLSSAGRVLPDGNSTGVKERAPIALDLGTLDTAGSAIQYEGSKPRIPIAFFDNPMPDAGKSRSFSVGDVATDWLGSGGAGLDCRLVGAPAVVRTADELQVRLKLKFSLLPQGGALEADGELDAVASCKLNSGFLDLNAASFTLRFDDPTLTFRPTGNSNQIELGLARLVLPNPLRARLDFSGQRDALEFIDLDKAPLTLQIPAEGGFAFDVTTLSVGVGGVTLAASVRHGAIEVGDSMKSLESAMQVRRPRGDIGKLKVVRGRLTEASLEAEARLKFFDDANGILTLRLFQEKPGADLSALAQFDVGVNRSFHARGLYLAIDVESIRLSIKYADGKWTPSGGITGSVAFEPEGALAGRLAEYGELFDGTRMHFENLDLSNLGKTGVRVEIAPRSIEVAKLFRATLRGFVIHEIGQFAKDPFRSLSLLGEIAFIAELPALDIGLTLGDIHVSQPKVGDLIPKIKIRRLGMSVALPSGFSFKGAVEEYDDDKEYGFGGEAYLKSSAFTGMHALVKLTRLRERELPAIVVYVDVERQDHLAYGFFLRQVGLGVGANQGLRGFSDETEPSPLFQRVDRAIRTGIRYPGSLSSWVPVVPKPGDDAVLSLVAFAQVSFGLLKRDVDHALMTTLVLSLDENLDIVAGINGWFFASPDDTLLEEFTARPALRGAIGLSPREQILFGRFKTLKGSKSGKTAEKNPVGRMLKQALEAMELTASFYADPRGALLEIAYPRQARYAIELGPARGVAEAGFRFGFYRGTQVVGLNLAARAEISGGFSGDLGFANVELSARAAFELQASFAGALASDGRIYVLADLMLTALLEIRARIYKRIRVNARFFSFTITLFDVSTSISLSATASLAVAIIPDGIGFRGSVDVHLGIAGFRFGARVHIASDGDRIDRCRDIIHKLVPPIDELVAARPAPALQGLLKTAAAPLALEATEDATAAAAALAAASLPPTAWQYFVRRVGARTRVVLFPRAGGDVGYPAFTGSSSTNSREHLIDFNGKWPVSLPRRGVTHGAGVLQIVELASKELVSEEQMRRQDASAAGALRVGDLLAELVADADAPKEQPEVVDTRTRNPVPGDFDDPAVLADPARRSTRLRIRYAGLDQAPTYDDHLRNARKKVEEQPGYSTPELTHRNAELLSFLLRLAEKPAADVSDKPEGDSFDPLDVAAAIGLVLDFDDPDGTLPDAIREHGVEAFASSLKMFGVAVDFTMPGGRATFEFQSDWSNWFQGRGEVALSWQLARNGNGEGPDSHTGVRHFRVRREVLSGPTGAETFLVTPSWTTYVDGSEQEKKRYHIRPRFQFVDNTLPPEAPALLRYVVDAIAEETDAGADEVVASTVFDLVYYQPVQAPATVTRAQSLLRLLPQGFTPAARVEFRTTIEWPYASTDPDTLTQEAVNRMKLRRRLVPAGKIGRYGAGDESDISLAWKAELQDVELRLPQIDQSRRMDTDLLPGEVDLEGVAWRRISWEVVETQADPVASRPASVMTVATYEASVELVPGNAEHNWAKLQIGQGQAAEFAVALRPIDKDRRQVELGTPMLRCRSALSTAPPNEKATEDERFTEGRQVAAIEWMHLQPSSTVHWLDARQVEAWPDIRVAEAAKPLEIALRGRLRHDPSSDHERGAAVAYRIWMRDRLDELDAGIHIAAKPATLLEVQPERVFRSFPRSVAVAMLPPPAKGEDKKRRPDWLLEAQGRETAFELVQRNPDSHGLKKHETASGMEVAITTRLYELIGQLTDKEQKRRARLDVVEPLYPAPQATSPHRAESLLKRYTPDADVHGWRLLEAIGASATIWVEADDDRVGIDEALNGGTLPPGVAIMRFQRMPRELRPPQADRSALYAVRAFDTQVLACLSQLADWIAAGDEQGEDMAKKLVANASDLTPLKRSISNALAGLAPGDEDADKSARKEFLLNLAGRVRTFVHNQNDGDEIRDATMVHVADRSIVTPADPGKAQAPAGEGALTVPAIEGMVEFRLPMDEGYARDLRLAIEVIHRHDVRPPPAPQPPAAMDECCQVDMPRTAALHPETFGIGLATEDGSVEVHVAPHAAQRAALYRESLKRRVQFIEQSVGMEARADDADEKSLATLFDGLAALDWDAWMETWNLERHPIAAGPWEFRAHSRADPVITRGGDSYRMPALPAGYLWSARVRTRAGVRRSDDDTSAEPSTGGVAPMFATKRGAGELVLAYVDHPAAARAEGSTLVAELPLARRIDALPESLRGYWAARDRQWTHGDRSAPVLHLPDVRAAYVVSARATDDSGGFADLVRVDLHDGNISARWLLDQEAPTVEATLFQFGEDSPRPAWTSALGLRIQLLLESGTPNTSLAWLAEGLAGDAPGWRIEISIERDGARYRCKEVT